MGEYETGYGKPPKRFQFRKGRSGNPRGRPKRQQTVTIAEAVESVLNATVTYRDGEKAKTASRRVASIEKLVRDALGGDVESAASLLDIRDHALRHRDAGVERISVEGWLPDYAGQTGEEKAEQTARAATQPAESAGSSENLDGVASVASLTTEPTSKPEV